MLQFNHQYNCPNFLKNTAFSMKIGRYNSSYNRNIKQPQLLIM
jgi:hypothetical protein